MQEFKTPEDILAYGKMVDGFANAAKAIADLQKLSVPRDTVKAVVGAGKYNDLAEEDTKYIIYGPEKTAAARGNFSGLFGAFYFVHRPELQLSQHAPMLLGKAGCRLQATVEGKSYSVPLDEVNFDFRERQAGQRGRITLRKPTVMCAEDGTIVTLDAGTPLSSPHDSRKWTNEAGMPSFRIIDASGKQLPSIGSSDIRYRGDESALLMLWGHIGSMGFKKHGQGSQKFRTIQLDGTDDDFTAQSAMIAWLESVKSHNGIDVMPAFNSYVREASQALNARPELLANMQAACEIAAQVKQVVERNKELEGTSFTESNPYSNGRELHSAYHILQTIVQGDRFARNTAGVDVDMAVAARMLDLPLEPHASKMDLSEIRSVVDDYDLRFRKVRGEIFIKQLNWDRMRADLLASEYLAGGRNKLKDAVDALTGIAAKTAAPNPGESPDIRPEVECLRQAYELIQKNYSERLLANKDKKTSYFGRTHRKSLDRLGSFLSLLEACDCDVEKLRGRYLAPAASQGGGFAKRIAAETNNDQSRAV